MTDLLLPLFFVFQQGEVDIKNRNKMKNKNKEKTQRLTIILLLQPPEFLKTHTYM